MKHLEEQIAAYLDGELGPVELAEARNHLQSCEKCRALLAEQQAVSRRFKALKPEIPTERMWSKIQARLKSPQIVNEPGLTAWEWLESWGLTLPRLGMATAACLGLVLVVTAGLRTPRLNQETAAGGQKFAAAETRKILRAPVAKKASPAKGSSTGRETWEPAGAYAPEPGPYASADESRQESSAPPAHHNMRPMVSAQEVSTAKSAGPYVAAPPEPELAPALSRAEAPPPVLPKALGGVGSDGQWDWGYFAKAVAARQWLDAAAELKAARQQGEAGAERSFSASMINLLSLPSQPLSSVGMAPESESWSSSDVKLVLIQANTWRLAPDGATARFGGDVMARLKGFRTVGPGFVYDFGQGQGVFERGTRFTRLANEKAVRVKDAEGKDYLGNEFTVVENAAYDFSKDVITLKAGQNAEP